MKTKLVTDTEMLYERAYKSLNNHSSYVDLDENLTFISGDKFCLPIKTFEVDGNEDVIEKLKKTPGFYGCERKNNKSNKVEFIGYLELGKDT